MGPLVSAEQLERVTGFLASGEQRGRRTVVGGARVGDKGYFVAPTVLEGAHAGNKVFDEEIFGPVVTAIPFKDVDEVAPAANETVYGLAAGIWTQRPHQGPPPDPEAEGRNRVGQHLQHLRRRAAVRRLQAVRLGS